MTNNFWQTLPPNFMVLAPMEDVTDVVFRTIVRQTNFGLPHVVVTEFTNCDGICSVGQARVIHRLRKNDNESPIVAQIWGQTVENYYETAKLCLELGFDGIDINMGCPEKRVIKIGACSALINNHAKAKQIIQAVQKAVSGKIPVSVKTRIGFKQIQTQEWFEFLLDQNLQAITVHGRTVAQDELPANWDEIKKVVDIKNARSNQQKIQVLKQKWISELA
jgi:tRNA-dihydrouridine synthase